MAVCTPGRILLLPHDRDSRPNGPYAVGAPGEVVDPRTIQPTNPGMNTDRSQGRQEVRARRITGEYVELQVRRMRHPV
ncbi:DUF6009 family protein [Streptomyces capoamus]|uniref:DUF6009 family protein n=1 Tax=Streptomyces capoamus TaxID=68183 RepID=UPI001E449A6E|nr:DUF6009 family protein [Streptomyces capoamus]